MLRRFHFAKIKSTSFSHLYKCIFFDNAIFVSNGELFLIIRRNCPGRLFRKMNPIPFFVKKVYFGILGCIIRNLVPRLSEAIRKREYKQDKN